MSDNNRKTLVSRTTLGGSALAAVLFSASFAAPAMAMTPEVTNVFGLDTANAISDQQQQQQQQHKLDGSSMAAAKPAMLSHLSRSA